MKYSKINNANDKVQFCIDESIRRLTDNHYKMGCYQYVSYFVKKHNLNIDEDLKIRQAISNYIDENASILFPVSFTINNQAV